MPPDLDPSVTEDAHAGMAQDRGATGAVQAARLCVTGEWAFELIHAVNNGLNAISMNAALARELAVRAELKGERTLLDALDRISLDCGRHADSLRSVVQFARDLTEFEPVSVASLLQELVRLKHEILRFKHIAIHTKGPEPDAEIAAGRLDLKQALLCMLRDGAEAGADAIHVEAAVVDSDIVFRVAYRAHTPDPADVSPGSLRRRFVSDVARSHGGTFVPSVADDGWCRAELRLPLAIEAA